MRRFVYLISYDATFAASGPTTGPLTIDAGGAEPFRVEPHTYTGLQVGAAVDEHAVATAGRRSISTGDAPVPSLVKTFSAGEPALPRSISEGVPATPIAP